MEKYSFKFKKKVVMACLTDECRENFLASKFNATSPRQLRYGANPIKSLEIRDYV